MIENVVVGSGNLFYHPHVRDKQNEIIDQVNLTTRSNTVVVNQASDLSGPLDSTKEYFINGIIDMSGVSIEVPVGGLSLNGANFNASGLICADDDYDLFTSPAGGSGDLVMQDFGITITGANSRVYGDLQSATGFNAIEIRAVNYYSCTSLGNIINYRQVLETGTGRFNGTPELTLTGAMNGYKLVETIALGMSNLTALFKAGAGLVFGGRFSTNINLNLPAVGAFADFTSANFTNNESFEISNATMRRLGVVDPSDTAIIPNITGADDKAYWRDNTGIRNTQKYLRSAVTAEIATPIAVINTYYPILGTFTVDDSSHVDMPANGQFRIRTGSDAYMVTGEISVTGTAGDVVDIRMTVSTDDGATFPTQVTHIRRVINNLVGPRDVAFFPVNFTVILNAGDRIRFEIENKTATNTVTMELDSFIALNKA